MQHLPDRVDSKPGTYEENCKHCKQEVAQYLTFGVIGHLGSLGRKTKHTMMKTAAWETSDNKTSSEAALQLDPKWITIIVCWTVVSPSSKPQRSATRPPPLSARRPHRGDTWPTFPLAPCCSRMRTWWGRSSPRGGGTWAGSPAERKRYVGWGGMRAERTAATRMSPRHDTGFCVFI